MKTKSFFRSALRNILKKKKKKEREIKKSLKHKGQEKKKKDLVLSLLSVGEAIILFQ